MQHQWWQSGTVYQIYPLSFMDGNGDGKGDLIGIKSRLDYLQDLGVDAIWMSPIYPSPFGDFGYDVADYTDVNPLFGDLEIFDSLVADIHGRGMKVILDLVPNHTSIEHEWFKESRSSRENAKRDWYLWKDPAPDGGPPNNWQANFGGDAWTLDETTGQYYCHLFDPCQPDLNWRNPQVRDAIYNAMRFWFDRGVDGFRVDVIFMMIKDAEFRDEPDNPRWREGKHSYWKHLHTHTTHQPETFEIIKQMRAVAEEYDDRCIIGEVFADIDTLMRYYGDNLDACHLPFNFGLTVGRWQFDKIVAFIQAYEAGLPQGAWPNWVLGNHDQPRIATRAGIDQAALAQMLLLTLRGTPTLYYGDELGMENVELPLEFVNDPAATDGELRNPGRDPERTPMQWDAGKHAGFTTSSPWLPVGADADTRNVKVQSGDEKSMLSLVKQLLALRKAEADLSVGDFKFISADEEVLVYERGDKHRIALNFGASEKTLPASGTITLNTLLDRKGEKVDGALTLRGNEGVILAA
ncbi:MAG: alpha-amylase family glycosyl hydrolase [Alphaproteobacteria bacterium]